jgi:hypothetical protein
VILGHVVGHQAFVLLGRQPDRVQFLLVGFLVELAERVEEAGLLAQLVQDQGRRGGQADPVQIFGEGIRRLDLGQSPPAGACRRTSA